MNDDFDHDFSAKFSSLRADRRGAGNPSRTYYTGQDIESQRLTAEEEQALFLELAADRDNPRIRDRVVRAYLGFALQQAHKDFAGRAETCRSKAGLTEDDAISAANHGLMHALDRFKPSNGARFTTYAGWWIKKMLHEARYAAHAVRVPVGDREKFVIFRRQEAEGLSKQQMAEISDVPVGEVTRIMALWSGRQDPMEMFDRGDTNQAVPLHEFLQDAPFEGVEREEVLAALEAAKNRLGMEELRLLHDRFSRNLTFKQISDQTGLSPRRVRKKIKAILLVLKLHLSPQHHAPTPKSSPAE